MIKMPFITDTPNNETNPTAAEMLKFWPRKDKAPSTPPAGGEWNAGKRHQTVAQWN